MRCLNCVGSFFEELKARRLERWGAMNRIRGVWLRRSAGMILAIACGAAILAPGLRADDNGTDATGPGTRAVRLSSVDGQVQLLQGNQVLADQAVPNTPLFEGTQVVTANDGRAEVQFEDGSVARISPDSSLTLKVLRGQGSTGDAEIVFNNGLGYFEIQGESENGNIRIRFGDNVITASGFTVIRVDLDKPPGAVAVFSGNAHIEGAGDVEIDLHGGESVALNAIDPSQYNLSESIEPDSWDAWNSDRDQALTAAASNRTDATRSFADSNNPAWSDLDANGSWYDVPNQGYVWSPYEASNPGWDPYGTGYWMSTPQYGYMWVSGEPWGYMPYQFGSWNYFNNFGWGWVPGLCQPWWNGGFGYGGGYGGGGWGYNVGNMPPRYRLPIRPRPRNPRPMEGLRSVGSQPLIAVNRRIPVGDTMLPSRDRTHNVMIAGNIAQPLRPIPDRPHYDHGSLTPGNTHAPVFSGNRPAPFGSVSGFNSTRQGYVRPTSPNINNRPGAWTGYRQSGSTASPGAYSSPGANSGSYARPTAPVRAPSSSTAAPSRSVGGGGGGGARPSGGGGAHPGGGGGGGGHPSGGPHR